MSSWLLLHYTVTHRVYEVQHRHVAVLRELQNANSNFFQCYHILSLLRAQIAVFNRIVQLQKDAKKEPVGDAPSAVTPHGDQDGDAVLDDPRCTYSICMILMCSCTSTTIEIQCDQYELGR